MKTTQMIALNDKNDIKDRPHISVISNIIFEPHLFPLVKRYFGENAVVLTIPFGEYIESEYANELASTDLLVVWLDLEILSPELFYDVTDRDICNIVELCQRVYANLQNVSHQRILWVLFDDYGMPMSAVNGHIFPTFTDKLNLKLYETLGDHVSFINLKHLIAEVGISNAYDPKGKYRWNAPYSKLLIEAVVKEIQKQYSIDKGVTKKCLILDCDNVLWGGILSEDGVENLKLDGRGLGRVYQDFQRFVLSLYYQGVILAICSKNDLTDVLKVFREHSEMILTEKHIACFQVNWEDKPNNIKRIAERLNIGYDSIVFVDDSLVEIEAVKTILPDVTSILFKRSMRYEQFFCFNLRKNHCMTDYEKRNETYRTNEFREVLKAEYSNYGDYINALKIKIDIHEALPIEYSRISELTQRVNKCTNGKRYTVAEIKKLISEYSVKLYSVIVSDRFSDLGLVGAIGIQGDVLTLFCLSCRALGREIEKQMLCYIKEIQQIRSLVYQYTGKNETIITQISEMFPNISVVDLND